MLATITNNKALSITLLYLAFGFLWILLSDQLLFSIIKEPQALLKFEHYKGWLFVAGSGVQIYYLVNKQLSKLKKAHSSLHETKNKFETIFEQAADAIFEGNFKGNFISVNNAACKLTEYTRQELLVLNMNNLFSESQLNEKPLRYDALSLGDSIIIERQMLTKSGNLIPIEMHSKKTAENHYIAVIRNISSQIEQRQELKRLVAERTAELENKNKELARLNQVFVGREFRIKELRDKIKALEAK